MSDALPNRSAAKLSPELSSPAVELRATRKEELAEVTRFLAGVFQVSSSARFISPRIFLWKYFEPRPDWAHPRSYVLIKDGVLAAHLGVWPVHFLLAGEPCLGAQALDWAADPQHPGSGSQLRAVMDTFADLQIGISGTEAAQRTRHKLGFRPWGNIARFVRVLRPWRRAKESAGSPLRRSVRLLRDVLHRPLRPVTACGEWTVEEVGSFEEGLNQASGVRPGDGELRPFHSAAQLNYFLACPESNARGMIFRHRGQLCGYALLTRIGGQARIACLRVSQGWDTAYHLATELAARDPQAYEVVAQASHPGEAVALRKNGYRVSDVHATAIHDPQKRVSLEWTPGLQMTESDAFFL